MITFSDFSKDRPRPVGGARGTVDYRYLVTGIMLAYGVYSLRQGIRNRKASDTVIGIVCLLASATLMYMHIRGSGRR